VIETIRTAVLTDQRQTSENGYEDLVVLVPDNVRADRAAQDRSTQRDGPYDGPRAVQQNERCCRDRGNTLPTIESDRAVVDMAIGGRTP